MKIQSQLKQKRKKTDRDHQWICIFRTLCDPTIALNNTWWTQSPITWGELSLTTHIKLRPRLNGRHLADDLFKFIFLNEMYEFRKKFHWGLFLRIQLQYCSIGWPLVKIMAWCRADNKPLSEPMMARLLMHICVTQPQWDIPNKKLLLSVIHNQIQLLLRQYRFKYHNSCCFF